MANSMRGEASLELAGQSYVVRVDMTALVAIAAALGVRTMDELRAAVFEIANFPKVVAAVLEASGHQVPAEAQRDMGWDQYANRILPALFRTRTEPENAEANPPKSRARK
jgi:hypothetical protein